MRKQSHARRVAPEAERGLAVLASWVKPLSAQEFGERIVRLGPLPPRPKVVLGVSGGADSMALALLARDWIRSVGGALHAVIIDHGLREAATLEAMVTEARLAHLGIAATRFRLRSLGDGRAVERRARAARLGLLEAVASDFDAVIVLLAHQALDQAETHLLRALRGSGALGLAGMAGGRATERAILLRPLLGVPPARLRATLKEGGVGWIEDLSNRTPPFRRSLLRGALGDRDGVGCGAAALRAASRAWAERRVLAEAARNRALGAAVALYPEGFARVLPGPLPVTALASLLRTLSGRDFVLSAAHLAAFARAPRPATLGGVRFLAAGRLGPGLLAVREGAAMAAAVPAIPGVLWDGRFRLAAAAQPPAGATFGAIGGAAARLRAYSPWPSAVLASLPALRVGERLVAVPHVGYPDAESCRKVPVLFSPKEPAGGVPFLTEPRGGD